jgi:5-methyltetrahydrofolate--homocysteine methyltransferase
VSPHRAGEAPGRGQQCVPERGARSTSSIAIRPAFGYPACPDHSEKQRLFELLSARSIGMNLTETYAMTPAASVSGLYLAHPQSKYFAIQRVGADQVADYAKRMGVELAVIERLLRPVLSYDPTPAGALS